MDPEEIEKREFLISLRGYDRDEVDAFAREVAQELKRLRAQVAAGPDSSVTTSEPPAASPPDRSDALKQIGEETSKILLAAEQVGADIKEKARREAAELLADAREQADKINAESAERHRQAENELRKLTEARSVLATQLEDVRRRLDETISRLSAPMVLPTTKSPGRSSPPVLKPVPDVKPEQKEATSVSGPAKTESPPTKVDGSTKTTLPREVEPPPSEPVVEDAAPTNSPSLADVLDEVRKEREAGRKEVEAALAEASEPQPSTKSDVDEDASLLAVEPVIEEEPSVSLDPLEARGKLLGDAPDTAARRMKRLLQEDQNDLLDRLRTHRGKGSVEENVAPEHEQVERFKEGLGEILGTAFKSGRKLAGAEGDGDVENVVVGLITKQLISPLRSEISRTVEAGLQAQDTATAISERASDVFRVWKGVRTEMLGEGLVHAAFHQGLIDAWRGRESAQKKWILDQERDCPKDVCKTNADAGPVGVDAAFPSGHMAPPAHGGCTCTLSDSSTTG